jgi:cytochrome o ubiquinol oxidase subunit II
VEKGYIKQPLMKTKYKLLFVGLGIVIIAEFAWLLKSLTHGHTIAILSPAGTVADQQQALIQFAAILGLAVILPVFALTFFIVWRFRDGNVKARYRPDWDSNKKLEAIWWGIPCAIILVLAVVTWQTSHSLDPSRPLESSRKPMTIQVVALNWKWLFIYPEQNIATVNYVQFPEDTPIHFEITSDGPMNSFWVPQLGGQIYAMAGMETTLQLMADNPGSYAGSSANLSGEGFAGMKFTAVSSTNGDFSRWVQSVWESPNRLTIGELEKLSKPSKNNPVTLYGGRDEDVYDTVMMKFMGHGEQTNEVTHVE